MSSPPRRTSVPKDEETALEPFGNATAGGGNRTGSASASSAKTSEATGLKPFAGPPTALAPRPDSSKRARERDAPAADAGVRRATVPSATTAAMHTDRPRPAAAPRAEARPGGRAAGAATTPASAAPKAPAMPPVSEISSAGGPGGIEPAGKENGPWCRTCGTRHVLAPCFRDYQATGTERHGWRALIEGKELPEVLGVLVAPVGAMWRARVLTYPNVVWMIPGGGSSMKFLGVTAAQAEAEAVLFLQDYLKSKGLRVSRRLPNLAAGDIDHEESAATQADQRIQAARRRVQYVPIWWGLEIPDEEGVSEDLSETGLFLITGKLQPKGARLALRLDASGTKVDMLGTVAWRREMLTGGRRVGMGIEIRTPPTAYVDYVRALP